MKPPSITYVVDESVRLAHPSEDAEGHIASARVELWNAYHVRAQANFASWQIAMITNNDAGPLCEMALTITPVESEP